MRSGKSRPFIDIVRVYDVHQSMRGYRVLVDRLWPRGVSKESLHLDRWAKGLAPSTELRKWFDHDVEKWSEFQVRYRAELSNKQDEREVLLNEADGEPLLLMYAAKDEKHNHAIVLKDFLLQD